MAHHKTDTFILKFYPGFETSLVFCGDNYEDPFVTDVLQRQRADVDSHADHWRRHAGAGADPCRGRGHALWRQLTGRRHKPRPLPRGANRALWRTLRAFGCTWIP